MREHFNDMPGDLADEDAQNLPGGYGVDNPDLNPDAMVDEVTGLDVLGPTGEGFIPVDQTPGSTAGTNIAEGENTGFTVDPDELVEGEEGHPGVGIGFTGGEAEKGRGDRAA